MRPTTLLQLLLPFLNLPTTSLSAGNSQQRPPGKNAILLSNVHSLTLRGGRLTSSRRVSPIPQLKCVGPSKRICNMYEIDSMRCRNEGYGYDEEDVQWTCTASLPGEFKLGSTDVICEGYRDADDPYVLKGSCGVEYRLLLTELGEKKFGQSFDEDEWRRSKKSGRQHTDSEPSLTGLGNVIFWGIFLGVFLFIAWGLIGQCLGWRRDQPQTGRRWGWGGGGGGGDGGDYPGGPPPPYSSSPYFSSSRSGQGWRPGFWTGAMTGTGVGYGLGRRGNRYDSPYPRGRRYGSDEGSSSSPSSSRFSTPTTSTGFGSTSRR
ncbi:DUF1183 domain protein [Aspergillus mulundensis]|uniref:Store-operated calcium entry-associated regulatory factor n=1 Tax=Aspergillus mulundensis TaxID=1810919 RepID=A0A3D8SC49_9EURO|nr:hypothetical protein DSM5745_04232 [Aspergillus mulundensis]RDW83906.1 hypothetical protein DSM5745_04232 [Aspergillus mulundensis]